MPEEERRITISVRQSVYDRIKKEGVFGESFGDVISRLLDELASRRTGYRGSKN